MDCDVIEDLHHIGVLYIVISKEDNLKEDADGLDSNGVVWGDIETLTRDNVSPFVWYALKKLMYKD